VSEKVDDSAFSMTDNSPFTVDAANEAGGGADRGTAASTVELNAHKAASMAYYIHSTDPRFHLPPRMFVGPTCVEQCLDQMLADADSYYVEKFDGV